MNDYFCLFDKEKNIKSDTDHAYIRDVALQSIVMANVYMEDNRLQEHISW